MRYLAFILSLCSLSLAAQVTRTGKDYAVFFYVTDFKPGLDDLPDTKPEAEALYATLSKDYGFTCKYVPECTKKAIEDELAYWNNRLKPGDQILFFFSMHGYYSAGSDRGYLVPADGLPDAQYNYYRTWLSYDDLRTYLEPNKASHVLVALDACYSGSFGIRSNKNVPDDHDAQQPTDCPQRLAEKMNYNARQFITAGKKTDAAPGKSAFAAEILKQLRSGYDSDNLLYLEDLAFKLHKLKTPEPEDGTFIGHQSGGDFVFLRQNACGTAPAPTPKNDPDLKAIELARREHTEEGWQLYLDNWPKGRYRNEAETALAQLQEDRIWKNALDRNTPTAYRAYEASYCPGGRYCTEAAKKTQAPPADDRLVLVKGGTFDMGSNDSESDEQPQHKVTVSDFYLGRYEVTVGEFREFIEATKYQTDAEQAGTSRVYENGSWTDKAGINWRHNPAGSTAGDNYPVINVSWNDAVAYCKWLSTKTGKTYRLPTEAEWEYAAGNGVKHTKYSWGNGNPSGKNGGSLADETGAAHHNWTKSAANIFMGYTDGYTDTAPVGQFNPNDFGLYDMSGNVWEWCSDWYGTYSKEAVTNPQGPSSGSSRVCRGGSWCSNPQGCRAAFRSGHTPGDRFSLIGFRLARTP